MTISSISPPAPDLQSRPLLGITFKIASVACFLVMASLLKASPGIPAGELVFFRSIFAVLPILAFLAVRRELLVGFRTAHPISHLWRGLIGTGGMGFGFYALTKLPLPEAVTINYATPLLIVVFSALLLHEKIRLYRWSAVVIGLVGVLVIISPQLTVFTSGGGGNSEVVMGTASALIACCFAATAMLLVRKLVTSERSSTIVLYFSLASSAVALLSIPFGWVMPSPQTAALMIGAGIAGGIGQILLTESYRHAEMSVVAPFEYSSLLLSVAVGYFMFAEIPTVQMLIGGLIVTGAGLFIIFREHRLGLDRTEARKVTTPQG